MEALCVFGLSAGLHCGSLCSPRSDAVDVLTFISSRLGAGGKLYWHMALLGALCVFRTFIIAGSGLGAGAGLVFCTFIIAGSGLGALLARGTGHAMTREIWETLKTKSAFVRARSKSLAAFFAPS